MLNYACTQITYNNKHLHVITLCSLCLAIILSACDTLLACSSTVNSVIISCIHDIKSLTCSVYVHNHMCNTMTVYIHTY